MIGEGGRIIAWVRSVGRVDVGAFSRADVKQCRTYGAGGSLFDFVPSACALG